MLTSCPIRPSAKPARRSGSPGSRGRLKGACKLNKGQFEAMLFLTTGNAVAGVSCASLPLWGVVLAILFWPLFVLLINWLEPPTAGLEVVHLQSKLDTR
jgi:hypothetical protein